MPDTNQVDLEGKKQPDVSMEEETKFFETYKTKHLKLTVEKDALDKLRVKLDGQIEKRKINANDKDKILKAWVQSKAHVTAKKTPLTEGVWGKETKQLYDEIVGE